jgi:hypothetical protein
MQRSGCIMLMMCFSCAHSLLAMTKLCSAQRMQPQQVRSGWHGPALFRWCCFGTLVDVLLLRIIETCLKLG